MSNINSDILVWARKTAKLSLDDAAERLNFKDSEVSSRASKLLEYENGNKEPSKTLLLKMSKIYRRPILVFYLEKPPRKGNRGQDFRTLPDGIEPRENAYIDTLIRELKARQSIVKEALIYEDEATILNFIGSHSIDDGIYKVCNTIRTFLNFVLHEYRSKSSYRDAFNYLREKTELAGVFVLLQRNLGSYHTDISVSFFRGFALADEIAPFILINDLDAESAWAFTLIHELTHLALGQTGISGENTEKKIEEFCNSVASEFLLPESEFKNQLFSSGNFDSLADQISKYAKKKKISASHIAYRSYKKGVLTLNQWNQLRQHYKKLWSERKVKERTKNRQKEGGPNYYILKQYKLGSLVNLVERLKYSGTLSNTKAGIVLNVRPLKVDRLFNNRVS